MNIPEGRGESVEFSLIRLMETEKKLTLQVKEEKKTPYTLSLKVK